MANWTIKRLKKHNCPTCKCSTDTTIALHLEEDHNGEVILMGTVGCTPQILMRFLTDGQAYVVNEISEKFNLHNNHIHIIKR